MPFFTKDLKDIKGLSTINARSESIAKASTWRKSFPGAIATTMQESVLTPEARQYFESLIPRGSMGQPNEVATVALFLASNDSSFVNGQELFVDGGMIAI